MGCVRQALGDASSKARMMSTKLEDHPHCLPRAKNDDARSSFPARERKKLPVPVSPVLHAALRAIYAGGPRNRWVSDSYGHPLYKYETRSGHITFFCVPAPDFTSRFHFYRNVLYTPSPLHPFRKSQTPGAQPVRGDSGYFPDPDVTHCGAGRSDE
jgi:hypothetical protein